jgi:MFS family permease
MAPSQEAHSPWAPFRHPTFAYLWVATVIANIGTWMFNVASAWLMTNLNPDPFIVSLVQVASSLPMFLFALPAGALADVVDRRRFLIAGMVANTVLSAIYAAMVSLGVADAVNLLVFTFLIGVASALFAPAWASVLPQLVPKEDLESAIAANSVGFNVSRAVGPLLGGIVLAAFGVALPFWLNAISNLGIIAALLWWHPPPQHPHRLPVERFVSAMRNGFRHARYNPDLRATLMRGAAFCLFASAYWALLPLVARDQLGGGPNLLGLLLGAIGAGATAGAFALPWLRAKLGPDLLVAAATFGTAIAMLLFAVSRAPLGGLAASLLAGLCWITVMSALNESAQVALPEWVRGRGLAMFMMTFFGALSLGSAVWGKVANLSGLSGAQLIAAAAMLIAVPLTWRFKLQTGAALNLAPSLNWPAPIVAGEIAQDRGPVLITVEYRIHPSERKAFLEALAKFAPERRRDGAYAYGVFEDAAEEGRIVETFMVESWLEHLRQHERVTNADRVLEEHVQRFQTQGAPKVTHLIAPTS